MKPLWRGSPAARTLWLAPDRSTILDKIIEFAKISAGLSFCVRATLRLWWRHVRPQKDALKNPSLPKWASSESRYEPPCAKLASCLLECHYTVLLTNSCPAAARFLRTPIKADTNFLGRILFRGRTRRHHCLSLSGQQIMRRARRTFSANS